MIVALINPRTVAERERRRTALLTLFGLLVAIYILAPFSWLLLTSFMHERDALSVPPQWIIEDPTTENYETFFEPTGTRSIVGSRAAAQLLPSMVNSLIVAIGTAALNLVLGVLAGYSFARLRFPGRTPLMVMYLGSRMVPGIVLIVPLYLTIKTYGLLDDVMALIVTYLTFTLPFTIWLLKSYFQGIPRELEEAALVDGCTWPKMVLRVLLPAAMPGLTAAAMFALHDGVERLSVRRHPDQHHGVKNRAGRGRGLRDRRHDRADADGRGRSACSHPAARSGVHLSAAHRPGAHRGSGKGVMRHDDAR